MGELGKTYLASVQTLMPYNPKPQERPLNDNREVKVLIPFVSLYISTAVTVYKNDYYIT